MSDNIKTKIVSELRLLFAYTLFLTIFFGAFATYRRLLLDEFTISYFHYGYCFVESLILAKLLLLGQHFHLGEKYANRPLIIPTLYKTFIFSIFVLVALIVEHFVIGTLHGKGYVLVYEELIEKGLYQILAGLFIMTFVFSLFFAVLEINRVMGNNQLFNLFFKRNIK